MADVEDAADEEALYKEDDAAEASQGEASQGEQPVAAEADEEGEAEEEEDNPFADDDEEEDGVQVTIGEIIPSAKFLKNSERTEHEGRRVKATIDLDSTPTIDGVVIYDVDLALSEDKPWRKPGADPADYFNYGFTEDSWNSYCERQKKLRAEFAGNQQIVNRQIMNSIHIANPLAAIQNVRSTDPGGVAGGIKVLIDNTDNYGRGQYGMARGRGRPMNDGMGSTIHSMGPASVVNISQPPPNYSRPPPMIIPSMGAQPQDLSATLAQQEPPPPGSEDLQDVLTPTSIPTLGGAAPAVIDTSMPPPGFNPSLPPPNFNMGGGMPNTSMPPPGFNPMMPPPVYGQMGGGFPPNMGAAGYGAPMGMGRGRGGPMGGARPPPLMGRDYDIERERRSGEYERRHERERDEGRRRDREEESDDDDRRRRASSPKRRTSRRGAEEEEKSSASRRDREERSSRRHRSRSRSGERSSRRGKEEKRGKDKDKEEERGDRKKRRHDRDDDRSDKEKEKKRSRKRSQEKDDEESGDQVVLNVKTEVPDE